MNGGPTIRIGDAGGGGGGSFPDVSASRDIGSTIEISDINDFDLGLLGNQRKLVTPPVGSGGGGGGGFGGDIKAVDDIEFVNVEDSAVSFDVKPIGGPASSDTIRILRDGPAPVAPQPIAAPSLSLNAPRAVDFSAPQSAAPSAPATKSWFSNLTGIGSSAPAPAPAQAEAANGGIRSWFGGGAGSTATVSAPATEYLTPEQEVAKKTEGLTMLERMDRKGIGGTKMTMANTLEEINAEVARRKDSKGLEASIRFQRSMLTTVTSGMEFLNSKYDPLGVALDGWSEQVNENIEDYDEIFEELYDKYKDKSKVAPEVRLIMSLGLSAAMCHVTNTMFKSKMPGMDDILRKNPDLARQMARAAAEQAVGPGFANFVSMGMPNSGGGMPRAPPPSEAFGMGTPPPMMSPMGGGMGGPIPSMDPRGGLDIGEPPATARREMRGPSGVDDILDQLNAAGRGAPSRSVPPPALDADEIASIGSGMTSATDRRAGLSRNKRRAATQPTGATLTLNV
jgi:hypothetical protein